MSAAPCPDDDQLVRMVEGALGDASLCELEAHVDGCERCAAVVAGLGAIASDAKPRVIGRYELDRRIAAGGMGEVWAAWDPQLRREIAIKLVRPDRAAGERERERLLREARALARLTHPNVLAVHDVGEHDGDSGRDSGREVFLATELVPGDTLASRGGPSADWRTLAALYAQAARGLAAAHAVGLVHRDIKPANLLLGTDGRVRVADFGLAVRARTPARTAASDDRGAPSTDTRSVTEHGHIAGTPAYMAPEQRAGAPADARADQYALCVALAESILGRRPTTTDRDALIAEVAERRSRDPALEELCGVIARGLASDPAARFADTTALAAALERCARPVASAPRRRRRWPIYALAATAGAGAVIAVAATREDRDRSPPVAIASPDAGVAPASITPPTPVLAIIDENVARAEHDRAQPAARLATPAARPSAPVIDPPAETERISTQPPGSGGVTPTTTTSSSPIVTIEAARAAIDRHDARSCRLALSTLPARLPDRRSDDLLAQARAHCEMIAGNCDGGAKLFGDRFPLPAAGLQVVVDSYCPPGNDPAVRLRRLSLQTLHRKSDQLDCAYFVEPARAARRAIATEADKQRVAAVLATLARCFAEHARCPDARALAAEATAVDPRLDPVSELGPDCRP
ncbi:MAG TPA: serine/threonine-protein kinase [Kofleriaceae bacterium]|nr:serine/threonine-protein kinase [Kofleriaceae bacterium]